MVSSLFTIEKAHFPPRKIIFEQNFFSKCVYIVQIAARVRTLILRWKYFEKFLYLAKKKKTNFFSMAKKSDFPPGKNKFWNFFAKVCLYRSNSCASPHANFEVKIFCQLFLYFHQVKIDSCTFFEALSCPQAGCRGATLARRGVQGVSPWVHYDPALFQVREQQHQQRQKKT